MDDPILLESGERVIVAVPQGEQCVFNKPRLEFIKPKWTEDAEAKQCLYCQNKFTQLRRKHHCRSCGRLFCSKCCNDKTVLTHLGINEFERTCLICKPVLKLMTKAFSQDIKLKEEAASGFQEHIQQMNHMQELLEAGGLHTLIWLCGVTSPRIYKPLVSALHTLATQASLQKYLLQAGIVQALASIMRNVNPAEQLYTDCISTLFILSSTENAVEHVVTNGGLTAILHTISKVDELSRLLSLQAIVKMSSTMQCHCCIMDNPNTVHYLTSLAGTSQDIQVTTLVFTILGEISAGQFLGHKVILAQAESSCLYVSKSLSTVKSNELLSNVCCLLANLASVAETQSLDLQAAARPALFTSQKHPNQGEWPRVSHYILMMHLSAIPTKLRSLIDDPSKPYYLHIIRAIANFSKFSQNSYVLMEYIPSVVNGMNATTDKDCLNLSLSLITNLLEQSPEEASHQVCRADAKIFLAKLMQIPGVGSSVSGILGTLTVTIRRPAMKQ